MKKIMQINLTCGVGSTGRLGVLLYDTCIVNGYDACFAYSCCKPTLSNAFRIETPLQNIVRRGFNKHIGKKQRHSTPGTKRLIQYIEKEQPDLIHLHNVHLNSVDYPFLFSYLKKMQIPILFTLHDCWAFTGGCYYFTNQNCEQYRFGCRSCPIPDEVDDITLGMEASYALKKELIEDNSNLKIVCVSQWLAGCARQSFGSKENILTIYNGIDTSVFRPVDSNVRMDLSIQPNSFIVLGIANVWDERKGLNTFIALRGHLPEQYFIVLVGLTEDQIAALPAGIKGIHKTEKVEELVKLYSCADVFFNASKEESFGLTTVEAMACGTPAIVYQSTASPELLTEETGYVVQTDDIDEVANAVQVLCTAGKEKHQKICVSHVRDHFDAHHMTDQYLELYRSILHE